MNKAKRYFVNTKGDMLGYPHWGVETIEQPAHTFHAKLRIARVGWLNKGFYFELEDEHGVTYCMNDIMFRKYLEHNEMFLEGDWNFYQQGSAFSIGL